MNAPFYRQPTLSFAYSPARRDTQPAARLSHRSNTSGRIGGAVNALSGQVSYVLASKCGITQLLKLYQQILKDYPAAEVIYLVEDNWSVHFHPSILAALVEQETRFELKVARSWQNIQAKAWKREKLLKQNRPAANLRERGVIQSKSYGDGSNKPFCICIARRTIGTT